MILYALDACALLCYFKRDEHGHQYMVDFIKSHSPECAIHAMNMAEVYYLTLGKLGAYRAEEVLRATRATGMSIVESLSEDFWKDAAWLKIHYQLGLMDAVAFALARKEKATLVTRDRNAFEGIKKATAAKMNLF